MIEAMKQWLEVLEYWDIHGGLNQPTEDAITSLRQAIKALESQEPVSTIEDLEQEIYQNTRNFVSLDVMEWMLKRYYTHPPQRRPLTDDQIYEMYNEPRSDAEMLAFARAIEAAHGIKGDA